MYPALLGNYLKEVEDFRQEEELDYNDSGSEEDKATMSEPSVIVSEEPVLPESSIIDEPVVQSESSVVVTETPVLPESPIIVEPTVMSVTPAVFEPPITLGSSSETVVVEDLSTNKSLQWTVWPGVPTPCPVRECGEHLYTSYHTFERHWVINHHPLVQLFKCPNCPKTSARRYNIKSHQKEVHRMTSIIESSQVHNRNYIEPKGVIPYKPNFRVQLQKKRLRIAEEAKKNEPTVGRQIDCRNEIASVNDQGLLTIKRNPRWFKK